MKDRSMFPFRRSNKKRGKGGRPHPGAPPGAGGRRPPSGPHQLLSQIQPVTKALAQMLAGHTRASGQLVHARNVLAQAEQLIEERQVERLPPSHREEFLEHLARLKLTIADADAAFAEEAAEAVEVEEAAEPRPGISPERLRELALSIAVSTSQPAPQPSLPEPAAEAMPEPEEPAPPAVAEAAAKPATIHTGARGDRLRLKPLRPAGTPEKLGAS
jgi:hypothetical protein